MKLFLTTDLPDVHHVITCEILDGWDNWQNWNKLTVAIEPPIEIFWVGKKTQIDQLVLLREHGIHEPDVFFETHAWVDMLAPAGYLEGAMLETRLGYYGLIHRTTEDAQQYIPARCGWRGES